MSVSRREVLQALAAVTDASPDRTTTIEALAGHLGSEEHIVGAHVDGLEDCELAIQSDAGEVRVTITGEELLDLDTDLMVLMDSQHQEADH